MTSMHTTLIRRASGDYINFCSIEQLGILLHLLIGILVQCRLSLHLTIFFPDHLLVSTYTLRWIEVYYKILNL